MQNKKSQVEDLLEYLFVVIVIVIVVFFFSFRGVSYAKSKSGQAKLTTIALDSDSLLLTYFSLPADITAETNVADLLTKYFVTNDENILKKINSVTNDFFSKSLLETDSASWSLEINYPGKKPLVIESERSRAIFLLRKEISKMTIPSFQNSAVEVKLFQTSAEELTPI